MICQRIMNLMLLFLILLVHAPISVAQTCGGTGSILIEMDVATGARRSGAKGLSLTCKTLPWEQSCGQTCWWTNTCKQRKGTSRYYKSFVTATTSSRYNSQSRSYEFLCCDLHVESTVNLNCTSFRRSYPKNIVKLSVRQPEDKKQHRFLRSINMKSRSQIGLIVVAEVCYINENISYPCTGPNGERNGNRSPNNQKGNAQQQQQANQNNQQSANNRPQNNNANPNNQNNNPNSNSNPGNNNPSSNANSQQSAVQNQQNAATGADQSAVGNSPRKSLVADAPQAKSALSPVREGANVAPYTSLAEGQELLATLGIACAVGCTVGGAVGVGIGVFLLGCYKISEIAYLSVQYPDTNEPYPFDTVIPVTCLEPYFPSATKPNTTTCTGPLTYTPLIQLNIYCDIGCEAQTFGSAEGNHSSITDSGFVPFGGNATVYCDPNGALPTLTGPDNTVYTTAQSTTCIDGQWSRTFSAYSCQGGCDPLQPVWNVTLSPAGSIAHAAAVDAGCADFEYFNMVNPSSTDVFTTIQQAICNSATGQYSNEVVATYQCIPTFCEQLTTINATEQNSLKTDQTFYTVSYINITKNNGEAILTCEQGLTYFELSSGATVFNVPQTTTCTNGAWDTDVSNFKCTPTFCQPFTLSDPSASIPLVKAAYVDYINALESLELTIDGVSGPQVNVTPSGKTAVVTCGVENLYELQGLNSVAQTPNPKPFTCESGEWQDLTTGFQCSPLYCETQALTNPPASYEVSEPNKATVNNEQVVPNGGTSVISCTGTYVSLYTGTADPLLELPQTLTCNEQTWEDANSVEVDTSEWKCEKWCQNFLDFTATNPVVFEAIPVTIQLLNDNVGPPAADVLKYGEDSNVKCDLNRERIKLHDGRVVGRTVTVVCGDDNTLYENTIGSDVTFSIHDIAEWECVLFCAFIWNFNNEAVAGESALPTVTYESPVYSDPTNTDIVGLEVGTSAELSCADTGYVLVDIENLGAAGGCDNVAPATTETSCTANGQSTSGVNPRFKASYLCLNSATAADSNACELETKPNNAVLAYSQLICSGGTVKAASTSTLTVTCTGLRTIHADNGSGGNSEIDREDPKSIVATCNSGSWSYENGSPKINTSVGIICKVKTQ